MRLGCARREIELQLRLQKVVFLAFRRSRESDSDSLQLASISFLFRTNPMSRLALTALFFFASCSFLVCQAQDTRTWKSANGNFSVEADYVSQADGNVSLKNKAGKILEVAIDKLSEKDKRYLAAQLKKEAPAKAPVWDGKPRSQMNLKSAKRVKVPENVEWKVDVKPLVLKTPTATNVIDLIKADPRLDLNPRMSGSFSLCNRDGTKAFFVSNDRIDSSLWRPESRAGQHTVVLRFDLTTGNKIGETTIAPQKFAPLDVSPNGNRMIAGSVFNKVINVVEYSNAADPKVVCSFSPYLLRMDSNKCEWAYFVDNDHIITIADEGQISLWDITKLKLIWELQGWPKSWPAISPDGKLIFARTENGLVAIEPLSGEIVAKVPCTLNGGGKLSVNPSGTKLVSVGHGIVREWDLATGKLNSNFAIPASLKICQQVRWVNDDLILIGADGPGNGAPTSHDLISLKHQCRIWTYSFLGSPMVACDGGIWCVKKTEDTTTNFENCKVPHDEALRMIDRAANGDYVVDFSSGNDDISVVIERDGENWPQQEDMETIITAMIKNVGHGVEFVDEQSDDAFLFKTRPNTQNTVWNAENTVIGFLADDQICWMGNRPYSTYSSRTNLISKNPWFWIGIPNRIRMLEFGFSASRPVPGGTFRDIEVLEEFAFDGFKRSVSVKGEN